MDHWYCAYINQWEMTLRILLLALLLLFVGTQWQKNNFVVGLIGVGGLHDGLEAVRVGVHHTVAL